jgi:hypothetical protein
MRQIAMDLLYRVGGIKGIDIGRIFGVRLQHRESGKEAIEGENAEG